MGKKAKNGSSPRVAATEESSNPHAGLMLPLSLTRRTTYHVIPRFPGLPDATGRFPESAKSVFISVHLWFRVLWVVATLTPITLQASAARLVFLSGAVTSPRAFGYWSSRTIWVRRDTASSWLNRRRTWGAR